MSRTPPYRPTTPNSPRGRKIMLYVSRRLLAGASDDEIAAELGRVFGVRPGGTPPPPEGLVDPESLKPIDPTREELQRFAEALEASLGEVAP